MDMAVSCTAFGATELKKHKYKSCLHATSASVRQRRCKRRAKMLRFFVNGITSENQQKSAFCILCTEAYSRTISVDKSTLETALMANRACSYAINWYAKKKANHYKKRNTLGFLKRASCVVRESKIKYSREISLFKIGSLPFSGSAHWT